MKKFISLLFSGVIAASMLTGCGSSSSSASSSPAASPAASPSASASDQAKQDTKKDGDVVTIDAWHYWDGSTQEVLTKYCDEFNKANPGLKINPVYIPYAEYNNKILVSAASGALPDVLIYGNNDTATLNAAGVLEDMTDAVVSNGYDKKDFEGTMNSAKVGDKYYGLPIYANCLAFFYNTDLVKTPPKTWGELKKVAKEVSTKDRYGLAVSATASEEGVFQWLPWLWSTGEDLGTIDSPNAVKALSLYKDMIDNGSMSKEVASYTQQDAMLAFATGRAAMMVNGPWNVDSIKKQAPDLKWAVTSLPIDKQGASILGGESFGIGKGKNKEAATKFFNYIFEPTTYGKFLDDLGQLPADKEMAKLPKFQNDPVKKAFCDALEVAKPRAYGAKYNEISKAIQDAMSAAMSGAQTPEAALKQAGTTIKPLISK